MIRGIIFDCYGVLCDGSSTCMRNERVVELVKTVHAGHQTALLSNINRSFVEQLFTSEELTDLFDVAILSSEVGMAKPDPSIYALAAQRLGLLPEECVMVDDSSTNVYGAERAGMHGLLYVTAAQCETELAQLLKEHNA